MTPFDHGTAVCGGATELDELQFQLDDIDANTTRASVEAKAGSGLQFDTDSSENEIAACFDFFFGDPIEVPQAVREPFALGDPPSAEELLRRDGIVALYKTEVRAAGSDSPRSVPLSHRVPLQGSITSPYGSASPGSDAALPALLQSSIAPPNGGVTSVPAGHEKSLDTGAQLPTGTAAGAHPHLAIPSVPFHRSLVECDSRNSVPSSGRVHSRAPLKPVRVVAGDGGDGGIKGRRARLHFGRQLAQRINSNQGNTAAATAPGDGALPQEASPPLLQEASPLLLQEAIPHLLQEASPPLLHELLQEASPPLLQEASPPLFQEACPPPLQGAYPPVLHEPDPSDEQTTSATTSPGTSISVAGNPDDHIDQQQLSRAVPLSHVGMPEGHQSLPKTPMRSRVDTSLTSQNTPTPLPITGQDVGSLDIDANESDNTRDERGNGTRRYETSFSTASEGTHAKHACTEK